jgi:hypothetical protein
MRLVKSRFSPICGRLKKTTINYNLLLNHKHIYLILETFQEKMRCTWVICIFSLPVSLTQVDYVCGGAGILKKNSMTLTLGVSIRPSILRPFHVKTAIEWLINYLGHKHLRVLIIHVASEKKTKKWECHGHIIETWRFSFHGNH